MKTVNNTIQRIRYGFLYLCVMMGALFCACQSPIDTPESEDGQAIIRIGDAGGRSLVPTTNPTFSKYELEFTAVGKTAVNKTLTTAEDRTAITGSGYAVALGAGEWNLTLTAWVSGSGNGYLQAARGTGSLTVSAAAATASADITLKPLDMDSAAKGIFTWNLDVSKISGTVTVSGTLTTGSSTTTFSETAGSLELASGYYDLVITVSNDDKSTGVYRAVHIYPGLSTRAEGSDFTFSFTGGDRNGLLM